jgi:hypothetical protein
VCFLVHKTISELERAILTTLFLPVQKTPIGLEHATFDVVLEVELQHPANNNTSTTAPRSSHNFGGTSSTQTNGGTLHQSPLWAPSLIQTIQDNAELEQVQVEDWEDHAFEAEAVEEELARVQQEIERLRQE